MSKGRTHQPIAHTPRHVQPKHETRLLRIGWRIPYVTRYWKRQVQRLELEQKRIAAALKRARDKAVDEQVAA